MRVFEDAWQRDDLPRGGVVTIGNFDGLHLGQRELIRRARESGERRGVDAIVVTFEPHPLTVLRPAQAPQRITTPEQKRQLIEASGVDALVIVGFSPEFAHTTAERFIEDFLIGRMAIAEVLVGSRFAFGRGREGSLEYLLERSAVLGFEAAGVPEVTHEGDAISSTRIRELVAVGEVERAREMLGRPFAVVGSVEGGEKRGRQLGWPTANLTVDNELFPGNGVYVTEAWIEGESSGRESVTNVGTRPTFGGQARRQIEAHLLDFEDDLYRRRIELKFCRKLRGERRFESPDELVAQIERDVRATREYFAACAC